MLRGTGEKGVELLTQRFVDALRVREALDCDNYFAFWSTGTRQDFDNFDAATRTGFGAMNILYLELPPVIFEPDLAGTASLEVEADDSLDGLDDETDPRSNAANMFAAVIFLE
jgi:hypothetical protein